MSRNVDDDPVNALIGTRVGGLHITKVLGLGTYGAVYAAEDTAQGHKNHFAVKCLFKEGLQPEHLALQRQEIAFNNLLGRHKNVTRLERVIETKAYLLLVFEFCHRGDLFELIQKEEAGIYDKSFACELFVQLIDAVAHCHSRGVYHRDLKPENVMLTEDWTVKLGDFGLATTEVFPTDFDCGSPPYMAPEVFSHYSPKPQPSYAAVPADVWSIGVIFFNMLYGQNPWEKAVSTDRHFKVFMDQPETSLSRRFAMNDQLLELFLGVFELQPRRRWSLARLKQAVQRLNLRSMHPTANKYSSSPAVHLQSGFYMHEHHTRPIKKMPLPQAVLESQQTSVSVPTSKSNRGIEKRRASETTTINAPISGRRGSLGSLAFSTSWADDDDDDMDFTAPPVLFDMDDLEEQSKPTAGISEHRSSPLRPATTSRLDSSYDSISNDDQDEEQHVSDDDIFEFEHDQEEEVTTPTPVASIRVPIKTNSPVIEEPAKTTSLLTKFNGLFKAEPTMSHKSTTNAAKISSFAHAAPLLVSN